MTRTTTPAEDVEALNRQMSRPEEARKALRTADFDTATTPASGAAVQHAAASAALSVEGRQHDASETADAIKRAAENDTRV
jgi:hypothetical protein